MVFQNSLYWLRGPANVWNSAVTPFGFYNGGLGPLAGKVKRLGYPLDCNADITRWFFPNLVGFCCGDFLPSDPSMT